MVTANHGLAHRPTPSRSRGNLRYLRIITIVGLLALMAALLPGISTSQVKPGRHFDIVTVVSALPATDVEMTASFVENGGKIELVGGPHCRPIHKIPLFITEISNVECHRASHNSRETIDLRLTYQQQMVLGTVIPVFGKVDRLVTIRVYAGPGYKALAIESPSRQVAISTYIDRGWVAGEPEPNNSVMPSELPRVGHEEPTAVPTAAAPRTTTATCNDSGIPVVTTPLAFSPKEATTETEVTFQFTIKNNGCGTFAPKTLAIGGHITPKEPKDVWDPLQDPDFTLAPGESRTITKKSVRKYVGTHEYFVAYETHHNTWRRIPDSNGSTASLYQTVTKAPAAESPAPTAVQTCEDNLTPYLTSFSTDPVGDIYQNQSVSVNYQFQHIGCDDFSPEGVRLVIQDPNGEVSYVEIDHRIILFSEEDAASVYEDLQFSLPGEHLLTVETRGGTSEDSWQTLNSRDGDPWVVTVEVLEETSGLQGEEPEGDADIEASAEETLEDGGNPTSPTSVTTLLDTEGACVDGALPTLSSLVPTFDTDFDGSDPVSISFSIDNVACEPYTPSVLEVYVYDPRGVTSVIFQSNSILVEPGTSLSTAFQYQPEMSGSHVIWVEAGDDLNSPDISSGGGDLQYLSFEIVGSLPLPVETTPVQDPIETESGSQEEAPVLSEDSEWESRYKVGCHYSWSWSPEFWSESCYGSSGNLGHALYDPIPDGCTYYYDGQYFYQDFWYECWTANTPPQESTSNIYSSVSGDWVFGFSAGCTYRWSNWEGIWYESSCTMSDYEWSILSDVPLSEPGMDGCYHYFDGTNFYYMDWC